MITRPSVNGLRATYLKAVNQLNFFGKSFEKGKACMHGSHFNGISQVYVVSGLYKAHIVFE